MTELEETESSRYAPSEKHSVAKSKASKQQSSKKSEADDSSNLSNYSFELTREEIAKIKRDYDRDPDRIADDVSLFKDLALEEMRAR
jgi:hypothetical protein